MPAKSPKKPAKIYSYDYHKVSVYLTPEEQRSVIAYCAVTEVEGKILKPGKMVRHILLSLVPKGAAIRKKLKVS